MNLLRILAVWAALSGAPSAKAATTPEADELLLEEPDGELPLVAPREDDTHAAVWVAHERTDVELGPSLSLMPTALVNDPWQATFGLAFGLRDNFTNDWGLGGVLGAYPLCVTGDTGVNGSRVAGREAAPPERRRLADLQGILEWHALRGRSRLLGVAMGHGFVSLGIGPSLAYATDPTYGAWKAGLAVRLRLFTPLNGPWGLSVEGAQVAESGFGELHVEHPVFLGAGIWRTLDQAQPATGRWSAEGPTEAALGRKRRFLVGGFGGVAPADAWETYVPLGVRAGWYFADQAGLEIAFAGYPAVRGRGPSPLDGGGVPRGAGTQRVDWTGDLSLRAPILEWTRQTRSPAGWSLALAPSVGAGLVGRTPWDARDNRDVTAAAFLGLSVDVVPLGLSIRDRLALRFEARTALLRGELTAPAMPVMFQGGLDVWL